MGGQGQARAGNVSTSKYKEKSLMVTNRLAFLQHYFQLALPYELENEQLQKRYVALRSDSTNDSQITGIT